MLRNELKGLLSIGFSCRYEPPDGHVQVLRSVTSGPAMRRNIRAAPALSPTSKANNCELAGGQTT